jgi:hypothetical protein
MTDPLFYVAMAARLARVLKAKLTADEFRDLVDILQDDTTDELLLTALTKLSHVADPPASVVASFP